MLQLQSYRGNDNDEMSVSLWRKLEYRCRSISSPPVSVLRAEDEIR